MITQSVVLSSLVDRHVLWPRGPTMLRRSLIEAPINLVVLMALERPTCSWSCRLRRCDCTHTNKYGRESKPRQDDHRQEQNLKNELVVFSDQGREKCDGVR